MRAMIISDSHGRRDNLIAVLKKHPDYEEIFHLGDVISDEHYLRNLTPYPVHIVRGNCDYGSKAPEELVFDFHGKKVIMCHGHKYLSYAGNVEKMCQVAKAKGADIFMFGHTHEPYIKELDGMLVLNPGSLALPRNENKNPTYIVLDIDDDGNFTYELCELTRRDLLRTGLRWH